MRNYVQGSLARLEHTFYDGEGNLVDPTFVRFATLRNADSVREFFDYDDPDQDSSSESSDSADDDDAAPGVVVRDSAGRYHVDVDTTPCSGVYAWVVRSENPVDSASGSFYVEPELIDTESSDDSSS